MEKVADVLRRKYPQFNTIAPLATVRDALYKMYTENVDYLIVMKEEKFVGILTEHDVVSKVLLAEKDLNQVCVQQFMTTALPFATADDSVEHAMQLLEHHNARYIAVHNHFQFKGILSAQDLMREALNKRKALFEEVPEKNPYPWIY